MKIKWKPKPKKKTSVDELERILREEEEKLAKVEAWYQQTMAMINKHTKP